MFTCSMRSSRPCQPRRSRPQNNTLMTPFRTLTVGDYGRMDPTQRRGRFGGLGRQASPAAAARSTGCATCPQLPSVKRTASVSLRDRKQRPHSWQIRALSESYCECMKNPLDWTRPGTTLHVRQCTSNWRCRSCPTCSHSRHVDTMRGWWLGSVPKGL